MNNEWHKYDMHLYRDSFQNYKVYQIPKAQLIIADVPYNLGTNAYGSNPSWYVDGDNKNGGKMIFNCMDWQRDTDTPKIHPTQKPVQLLERLISIFTDEGETVIDPCCGSGSTLLAAQKMSRKSFGFEVDRNFFNAAKDKVLASFEPDMFQMLKFENTIMNPPFAGGKA